MLRMLNFCLLGSLLSASQPEQLYALLTGRRHKKGAQPMLHMSLEQDVQER